MRVGAAALAERIRNSLFVVPMLFVLGAVVLAQAGIVVDHSIGTVGQDLPLGVASTVESARAVLSTVAGATITVAGIAFSVSLLTIQLASSQYSPRVVTGFFRDPFNKRVIGIVVGTFTYCLVVLRAVRTSVERHGDPVIPNASVAVGVLLGIASILAVIAFIDHNAHAMDISKILDGVTAGAVGSLHRHWSTQSAGRREAATPLPVPTGAGTTVRFDRDGWVRLVDLEALADVAPEHGTVRVEVAVGGYAIHGAPLCTIWPAPDDAEVAARRARRSVRVGETRTLQQDATYGLRQLVDVALRALSPGVNDPTTAQDAIYHVATVLRAFLDAEQPARDLLIDDRRVLLAEARTLPDIVGLAYDEVRRAAVPHPAVVVYLLESMALVRESLPADRGHARRLLDEHARLVLDASRRADTSVHDQEQVERSYSRLFGGTGASARRDPDGR